MKYSTTSKKTAIKRKAASRPLLKIIEHIESSHSYWTSDTRDLMQILDHGSGHGKDAEHLHSMGWLVKACDPNHPNHPVIERPAELDQFDVVLSTYVLNVIPPSLREDYFQDLLSYAKNGGLFHDKSRYYITVRTDVKRQGFTGRGGAYQCNPISDGLKVALANAMIEPEIKGSGFLTYCLSEGELEHFAALLYWDNHSSL